MEFVNSAELRTRAQRLALQERIVAPCFADSHFSLQVFGGSAFQNVCPFFLSHQISSLNLTIKSVISGNYGCADKDSCVEMSMAKL